MKTDIEALEIRDKQVIEKFLRENPFIHLYSIGDLDEFFWPNTRWIALLSAGKIISILLLYNDIKLPVLLALNHRIHQLDIKSSPLLSPFFPSKLSAHLTPDFKELLKREFYLESNGIHYKMGLIDYSFIKNRDTSIVIRLNIEDLDALIDLYCKSYPENWFNEKMLLTGLYYGIKINHELVSVAGVHVFSENYRVAALGNITTHPEYRNKGLAEMVTACLCQHLSTRVDHIGLNVHADNLSAIKCYENLGFEIQGNYEECTLTLIDRYI